MISDPGLYDFWPYINRPKIEWPDGKKIAFMVAPNIEFYELNPPTNPHRKSWPRPYPDITPYSYRDHGNRVGHWRLMEMMDDYNVRGSVSLSIAMCQHHPEILEATVERKWDFFSHGIYNTRYSYGMDEAQERAILEDSIKTIMDATGQRVKGYLAPALTHTEHTMNLLTEMGFTYTADLFQDDQPQPIKVKSGKLISMPYSLEVNDHYAYNVYGNAPRQYTDLLKRQFDQLLEEGNESGTVMCIPLHAYLVGRSHRMEPFRYVLEYICNQNKDEVWVTTSGEIADYYYDNYYDAALADIEKYSA